MLLGSGSYIESNENKYLISNEHVLKHLANITLAHQFFENDVIIKLTNPAFYEKAPVDVAISKISSESWGICEHKAKAIPIERFALRHEPVKNEAFFLLVIAEKGHNSYSVIYVQQVRLI